MFISCHGEKDNVVFELAKSKNVLSSNAFRYEPYRLYRSDGVPVPQNIANQLSDLTRRLLDESEFASDSCATSLGNYMLKRLLCL